MLFYEDFQRETYLYRYALAEYACFNPNLYRKAKYL